MTTEAGRVNKERNRLHVPDAVKAMVEQMTVGDMGAAMKEAMKKAAHEAAEKN